MGPLNRVLSPQSYRSRRCQGQASLGADPVQISDRAQGHVDSWSSSRCLALILASGAELAPTNLAHPEQLLSGANLLLRTQSAQEPTSEPETGSCEDILEGGC